MQRSLNKELNYFEKIVSTCPLGIAVFDQDGQWLHFNTALLHFLGYAQEEFTQTSFFDHLYEKATFITGLHSLQLVSSGESTKQLTTLFVHKSGERLWASTTCSLLSSFKDNVIVYSVQILDLTSQKKTEEHLFTTHRLSSAGQLAAGMAHEVRNPLTAIKGFVQLLKRDDQSQEYLTVIESEINRMENILSEFLLLGKPRKNFLCQVQIKDVITHVVTLLHSQAHLYKIELQLEIENDLPYIIGNETQLKQVFINLLKNAIESMETAGCIYCTVKRDLHHIVVEIKDQGPGIPEEKLKKLGSPFYSTKEKGTGLGLMISFLIIEEHKGSLQFSSTPSGTTVKVLLPVNLTDHR